MQKVSTTRLGRVWNFLAATCTLVVGNFLGLQPSSAQDSGVVAYYRFDEGSGTEVIDDITGNVHGTLQDGFAYSTDVPCLAQPSCFSLNFTESGFATIIGADFVFHNPTGDATVEWFMKVPSPGDDHSAIFYTTTGAADVNRFNIFFNADFTGVPGSARSVAGDFYNAVNPDVEYQVGLFDNGNALSLDVWNHVAIVRTAEAGQNQFSWKWYINGTLSANHSTTTDDVMPNPPGGWLLGGRGDSSSFNGLIDEVRLTNRALTPGEFLSASDSNPDCVCEPPAEICDNGDDDDGDGLTDCEDLDCSAAGNCQPENCINGVDDNGDGLTDCDDPDCSEVTECQGCDGPDTECLEFNVLGPDGTDSPGQGAGTYTFPFDAVDTNGSQLSFTLQGSSNQGETLSQTTVGNPDVVVDLNFGIWNFTGSVTDDPSCEGEDSSCGLVAVVEVVDSTPPTLTCSDIDAACDEASGQFVDFTVTAEDDSAAVNMSCDREPGSFFLPGITEVTCTATDSSGNFSTCKFNVNVTDCSSASCEVLLGGPGGAAEGQPFELEFTLVGDVDPETAVVEFSSVENGAVQVGDGTATATCDGTGDFAVTVCVAGGGCAEIFCDDITVSCLTFPICTVVVSDSSLSFEAVPVGDFKELPLVLFNPGSDPVTITPVINSGVESFSMSEGLESVTIAPGQTEEIKILYIAESSATTEPEPGNLTLLCGAEVLKNVSLTGMTGVPVAEISSEIFDFVTETGQPISKTFTVFNTGTAELQLQAEELDLPGIVSDFPLETFTIQPGESREFMLTLLAESESNIQGAIEISSNDRDDPILISVTAAVRDSLCAIRVNPPPVGRRPHLSPGSSMTFAATAYGLGVADPSAVRWEVAGGSGDATLVDHGDGTATVTCNQPGRVLLRVVSEELEDCWEMVGITCAESVRTHGTLASAVGPQVRDDQLARWLDECFEDGSKGDGCVASNIMMVLVMCYSGNFCENINDNLEDSSGDATTDTVKFSNSTVLAAASPGTLAYGFGFSGGASTTLRIGAVAEEIFLAGIDSKYVLESPVQTGDLARTVGGTTSTHVVVWGGNPDDAAIVEDIRRVVKSFKGALNCTKITVLAGKNDGGVFLDPQHTIFVDKAATAKNLKETLTEIGGLMKDTEQFILFATGHGGIEYQTGSPLTIEAPASASEPASTSATCEIECVAIDDMLRDQENEPSLSLNVGDGTFETGDPDLENVSIFLNGELLGTLADAQVIEDQASADRQLFDSFIWTFDEAILNRDDCLQGESGATIQQEVTVESSIVGEDILFGPATVCTGDIARPIPGDDDRDGLPDAWEESFFPGDLTALSGDSDRDGDGLSDVGEYVFGTDPTDRDSDADGQSDGDEINLDRDPTDPADSREGVEIVGECFDPSRDPLPDDWSRLPGGNFQIELPTNGSFQFTANVLPGEELLVWLDHAPIATLECTETGCTFTYGDGPPQAVPGDGHGMIFRFDNRAQSPDPDPLRFNGAGDFTGIYLNLDCPQEECTVVIDPPETIGGVVATQPGVPPSVPLDENTCNLELTITDDLPFVPGFFGESPPRATGAVYQVTDGDTNYFYADEFELGGVIKFTGGPFVVEDGTVQVDCESANDPPEIHVTPATTARPDSILGDVTTRLTLCSAVEISGNEDGVLICAREGDIVVQEGATNDNPVGLDFGGPRLPNSWNLRDSFGAVVASGDFENPLETVFMRDSRTGPENTNCILLTRVENPTFEVTVEGHTLSQPVFVGGRLVFSESDLMPFLRGDCNQDGDVAGTVADAVFLLGYNFIGTAEPTCFAACDVNADGEIRGTVADALYMLNFSFLGGEPPAAPYPSCGVVPPEDGALGCRESSCDS